MSSRHHSVKVLITTNGSYSCYGNSSVISFKIREELVCQCMSCSSRIISEMLPEFPKPVIQS